MTIRDFIDKCSNLQHKEKMKNSCLHLPKHTKINDALDHIQKFKSHIVIVKDENDENTPSNNCIGVLTLEDIIE